MIIVHKSCVKEVFSRAMFSRNVLVVVLLCLTIGRRFCAHAVEPIPRCCAEGSVLVFQSESSYKCENNGSSYEDESDSVVGLPVCTDGGRFENQSIEDADFGIIPQRSCVDVLTGLPEGDRTVVLYCANDKNSPGSHRVPSFINVRRCCPRGERFSTETRGCLPTDEPDTQIEAISLLKSFSRIDYVFEKRGLPVCDQAVFDYEVNSWDISLNAEKLELTLTASDDVSSISITEENACLDVGSEPGLVVVRACRDLALCRRRPCLRKCCPEDEALHSGACHKLPSNFTVSKWHQTIWEIPQSVENMTVEMLNTTDYGLIFGKPCMFGMYPIFPEEEWHLVPEGGLHVPGYRTYDHHEYCTDMFYNNSLVDDGFYPFVCFEGSPPTHTFSKTRFKVHAVFLWISSAFLLVTLLVYICLPALQNLHGLTLMCHVGSLFMAYFCLGIVAVATPKSSQLNPESDDDDEASTFCKFMGYTTFFSFLSAFFWLNVICFDIWWKFGSLRHSERSNTRRRGPTRRFTSYCVYAWGLSFVVALFALTSDHFRFLPKSLTPGIGREACWFRSGSDYYGEVLFFTGPISIQLIVNLIFFILTARRCNMVKEEIRRRVMINRTDSRSRGFQADKTKLILNAKLFVVMGVSWVLEVISYFLNHYMSHLEWKEELFYISDAVNALQGLLIFVLFVLKKKVFQALKRRLGWDSPTHASTGGIHDPFRVKKSVSSSTLMTTFAGSTAP